MNESNAATATDNPLYVPELVDIVISHTDRLDLQSCALVNHTWFGIAISRIWSQCYFNTEKPQDKHLSKLTRLGKVAPDKAVETQQFYASSIRKLEGRGGYNLHRLKKFTHLQFDHLQDLFLPKLLLGDTKDIQLLLQLFVPTLTTVRLRKNVLPDHMWQILTAQCKAIRTLEIQLECQPRMRVSSTAGFVDTLRKMTNLQEVVIGTWNMSTHELWNEAIFETLAYHPSIRSISSLPIPESWLLTLYASATHGAVPAAFPRLEAIKLYSTARGFSTMTDLAPGIKKLLVRICEDSHHTLAIASKLKGLQDLHIICARTESFLYACDLLTLGKNCDKLTEFRMIGPWKNLELVDVTGETMLAFFGSLPRLCSFVLEARANKVITEAARELKARFTTKQFTSNRFFGTFMISYHGTTVST